MKIDFNLFLPGTPRAGLISAFTVTFAATVATTLIGSAALPAAEAKTIAQGQPIYAPEGCRITRDRIGVYEEPNTAQNARGILQKGVTVLLGLGSGDGWARITGPQTGWVQAKFLKGGDKTPCPASLKPVPSRPSATPSPSVPAIPRPPLPAQVTPPSSSSSPARIQRAVCEVIPESGLVVRDTPVTPSSRIIGQIRPGRHTFQFSDRRLETETVEGIRQWVYITAPAKGWISTGFAEGGANLSGNNCR